MELLTSRFDYELPQELIAQAPASTRDKSRLFVINRATPGKFEHKTFSDISGYLDEGDCLVINTTKVFPARLFCRKQTGGLIELLFLNQSAKNTWLVLARENVLGKTLLFPDNSTTGTITNRTTNGEFEIKIQPETADVYAILDKYGKMPLPPYIKRNKMEDTFSGMDNERYQTVYAHQSGSIAAPTAGLHFTKEILDTLKSKGVVIAEIVLHVGWGTFRLINSEFVNHHTMLPEKFSISTETIGKIIECKNREKRIVAVGTTVTRTLETWGAKYNMQKSEITAESDMFIYPGYKFTIIDSLITNFHLPKSTPLMLVSAFAGIDTIKSAYKEAIENKYRFYSYGDAMLVI